MVNTIIHGISRKLFDLFGADYEIYTQDVTQGLNEPCFFIAHVTSTDKQYLGNRRLVRHAFDVHYFPVQDAALREDMHDVAWSLDEGLLYITDEDGRVLRGTNKHYEIVDNVLHFFVNYDGFVNQYEDTDAMDEMDQTIKMEG